MPIYEYRAIDREKGCEKCKNTFEVFQKMSADSLKTCPECGVPITKIISTCAVSYGFDYRNKNAGFTKLVKNSEGGYTKEYGPGITPDMD